MPNFYRFKYRELDKFLYKIKSNTCFTMKFKKNGHDHEIKNICVINNFNKTMRYG